MATRHTPDDHILNHLHLSDSIHGTIIDILLTKDKLHIQLSFTMNKFTTHQKNCNQLEHPKRREWSPYRKTSTHFIQHEFNPLTTVVEKDQVTYDSNRILRISAPFIQYKQILIESLTQTAKSGL